MNPISKTVTRCVCRYRTFEQIRLLMDTYGLSTMQEVMDKKIAGDNCGMCRPYISNMIKTGQFTFAPGEIDLDFKD